MCARVRVTGCLYNAVMQIWYSWKLHKEKAYSPSLTHTYTLARGSIHAFVQLMVNSSPVHKFYCKLFPSLWGRGVELSLTWWPRAGGRGCKRCRRRSRGGCRPERKRCRWKRGDQGWTIEPLKWCHCVTKPTSRVCFLNSKAPRTYLFLEEGAAVMVEDGWEVLAARRWSQAVVQCQRDRGQFVPELIILLTV